MYKSILFGVQPCTMKNTFFPTIVHRKCIQKFHLSWTNVCRSGVCWYLCNLCMYPLLAFESESLSFCVSLVINTQWLPITEPIGTSDSAAIYSHRYFLPLLLLMDMMTRQRDLRTFLQLLTLLSRANPHHHSMRWLSTEEMLGDVLHDLHLILWWLWLCFVMQNADGSCIWRNRAFLNARR